LGGLIERVITNDVLVTCEVSTSVVPVSDKLILKAKLIIVEGAED